MVKECEQKTQNKTIQVPWGSMSLAASLVSEDTKFLKKMGQLTTSAAMMANVFQRKKQKQEEPPVNMKMDFKQTGSLY